MANTRLHLGSGNFLYYENGQAVKVNGSPVKRWDDSNKRWSNSSGQEVKEFKGKTILDLEEILWYMLLWKAKKRDDNIPLFLMFRTLFGPFLYV